MGARSGLAEAAARPVDGASLGALRALFGAILALEIARFFAGGWIERDYLAPAFHFTYPGFAWVRPLPAPYLQVFFALLLATAVGLALGLFHRACAAFFALGFAYVFLLEEARYLNHFYLVVLLAVLLAALPVDRALALDARRRGTPPWVPAWTLALVRFQIGIVYLYAALAKLNEDWLLRAEPLRSWLASRADRPVLGPLFARPETAWAMSWAGFGLDLAAWPLLAWRRTRGLAFGALAVFHLTNAATFGIGIFPWLMLAATAVFFPPDWPRRALARLARRPPSALSPPGALPPPPGAPAPSRVGLALAAAWVAVQVLVPLRHFLYPGSVHWTEEGHAFSWHMKLRSKDGAVTYAVRDPRTGEEWLVDPRAELEPWQAAKLVGRPRMILQYAHHLRDRFAAEGRPGVEVRAWSEVSLNGLERRPLVDPEVDLAAVRPSLGPAAWILPLER